MHIDNSYKYEIDGITYVSGKVPEGATILEIMDILTADDGYELVCKANGERVGCSVWLKDGDSQENYIEIKAQKNDENPSN